jgi:hypothetical protein
MYANYPAPPSGQVNPTTAVAASDESAPFMSGGYDWSIARASPVTAETTLNIGDGSKPQEAPAAQSFYVATVSLNNSTSWLRAGLKQDAKTDITFGIPVTDAPARGWKYSDNYKGFGGVTIRAGRARCSCATSPT